MRELNGTGPRLTALFFLVAAALIAPPAFADHMTLLTIVHDQCVVHIEAGQGAKPCVAVDISQGEDRGMALLKDQVGVAQILLIPTRKLSGIEDAALFASEAPPYFGAAWAARARIEQTLGRPLPREDVSIAINSMVRRSQDQAHLHVDCLDKDVAAALRAYADPLDEQWRSMNVVLNGRRYWARRLESADLSDVSPLGLLADGLPGARQEMGLWSLAVVGATFSGQPGFILLADRAESAEGGHAEDLQDHACGIAKPEP
jgi:CDP-diacylglycerol pyrophosphatase